MPGHHQHAAVPAETPGIIAAVEVNSLAGQLQLQPGDELLAVNGHPVEDVIDVLFYSADEQVEFRIRRNGVTRTVSGRRRSGQPLGLEFTHPTFDIDIRRCNNLCPFCFVLQTAPRMRRTLYIKDDDYRYSFLYGHYVTLTNLSDHDWQRIERQRLSPLYISVHATDPAVRRSCLRNAHAPDILAQLRWLGERGIRCHTQLVITPGLNDGAQLQRSVHDLAELYPAVQSVSVVPVGLTKHHKYGQRPNTEAESNAVLDAVHAWQEVYLGRFGVRFVHATDEWYLITGRPVPPIADIAGLDLQENGLGQVRGFLEAWQDERAEVRAQRPLLRSRRATLVSGLLFGPTLERITAEFNALAGTHLVVAPLVNQRLGESITVAGLLMGHDAIEQLAGRDRGECVVLPRVMFDHPRGISLDDVSPLEVARALDTPVYLGDRMGDVLDALTGRNALAFHPQDESISLDVMQAGGWSLEKYL